MLILIAHGSRNPRWRGSVEGLVSALADDLGPGRVRLAYMELASPSLHDVVSGLHRDGVTRARVLPLFLAAEGHVTRDVEPLVDEVRRQVPTVHLELLPPMGQNPEFRRALEGIARRTVEHPASTSEAQS